jgi:hypothetical protein
MENVKVDIRKPIDGKFGTHVYIRDIYVEQAIRKGVKLEITIPSGKGVVDPVAWKNRGDIRKDVFLRPNEPMVLYGGFVPVVPINKKKVTTTKVTTIVIEEEQTKLF